MRNIGAGRVRNVQKYANVVSRYNMIATNEKTEFFFLQKIEMTNN